MKTREIKAGEIMLPVSINDISEIPFSEKKYPIIDDAASATIETALRIRCSGANLFICGPSSPEREAAINMAVNTKPSERDYPVVFEHNPCPENLAGYTAKDNPQIINHGSIMNSSGGILIVNAEDILDSEEGWKILKKVLRTGIVRPGEGQNRSRREAGRLISVTELKTDLKVVMTGNESHYDELFNSDEDFREQFQFYAELDSSTDLTKETLAETVNYYRTFAAAIGKTLSDAAALELIKYSAASAENNSKLSTITSEAEMIIREAALYTDSAAEIADEHIKTAIERQNSSFTLFEKKVIEDFVSGEINLKVEGAETGKVNGLAVIDKGPWSFGFPGLISARIAPGENGLVNIEHEAGLSGEIHDKWVLILEGFLRSSFARDFPLSIFASICFEQSYSEIDGDSASSSELYALLSAIADVPLRQDIAVTGSLSQTGEIQAVGGLGEKIEGFYKACRAINFTGTQGVIVPERNIKNIVLPDCIIRDIEDGSFHIYPVSTVDDSMEILTGMDAGKRNSRGIFPHGSLNSIIEKNLKKLASQAKNFGN